MSNSDQDDYMSNDLLKLIPDTRPGLTFTHGQLRKNVVEKRRQEADELNREKFKKIHHQELLKRNEALSKSTLDASNRGFSLMRKMGFQLGQSLGKSNTNGIIEPIGIQIKQDRQGLGADQEAKRKCEATKESVEKKQKLDDQVIQNFYLNSKREKFKLNKLRGNLYKMQKIIYHLDRQKNKLEPIKEWYWPRTVVQLENTNEHDLDYDNSNIKKNLKKFNLLEVEEEHHDDQECNEINANFLNSQIETLIGYLRNTYFYCFWCSVNYSSELDMSKVCPGVNEEDHDD